MLKLENVTVRYGEKTAVDGVSLDVQEGQWLMLVGPNGAGKSTMVEALARGVPYTGRVLLDGVDIKTYKPAQLAKKIGVLSQRNAVEYPYTVEEVVALGRYAYAPHFLTARDQEGKAQVEKALALTGLTELRHARVTALSGGETQRVFLAQVFAQDPQILLLDEPANHLDLPYQQQVFSLIGSWVRQPGRAVLSVVHDLSLARKYGTHAVLMDHGRCAASGPIEQVLTADSLRRVYQMDVGEWMRGLLAQWQ